MPLFRLASHQFPCTNLSAFDSSYEAIGLNLNYKNDYIKNPTKFGDFDKTSENARCKEKISHMFFTLIKALGDEREFSNGNDGQRKETVHWRCYLDPLRPKRLPGKAAQREIGQRFILIVKKQRLMEKGDDHITEIITKANALETYLSGGGSVSGPLNRRGGGGLGGGGFDSGFGGGGMFMGRGGRSAGGYVGKASEGEAFGYNQLLLADYPHQSYPLSRITSKTELARILTQVNLPTKINYTTMPEHTIDSPLTFEDNPMRVEHALALQKIISLTAGDDVDDKQRDITEYIEYDKHTGKAVGYKVPYPVYQLTAEQLQLNSIMDTNMPNPETRVSYDTEEYRRIRERLETGGVPFTNDSEMNILRYNSVEKLLASRRKPDETDDQYYDRQSKMIYDENIGHSYGQVEDLDEDVLHARNLERRRDIVMHISNMRSVRRWMPDAIEYEIKRIQSEAQIDGLPMMLNPQIEAKRKALSETVFDSTSDVEIQKIMESWMTTFFKIATQEFERVWNIKGNVSDGLRSIIKYLNEHIDARRSLFMPWGKITKNLSLWNDFCLLFLLQQEMVFKASTCHMITLTEWICHMNSSDVERKTHTHVLNVGGAAQSKSHVLDTIAEMSVDETMIFFTYKTIKSDASEGNSDGMSECFHEAPRGALGVSTNGSNTPQPTDQETMLKSVLTSGEIKLRTLVTDTSGPRAKRVSENLRHKKSISVFMNSNDPVSKMSKEIVSRFFVVHFSEKKRDGRDIVDLIAETENAAFKQMKRDCLESMKRMQCLIHLTNHMIKCGILPRVNTSYSSTMYRKILREAMTVGVTNTGNPRHYTRMIACVRVAVIVRAIILHFSSSISPVGPLSFDKQRENEAVRTEAFALKKRQCEDGIAAIEASRSKHRAKHNRSGFGGDGGSGSDQSAMDTSRDDAFSSGFDKAVRGLHAQESGIALSDEQVLARRSFVDRDVEMDLGESKSSGLDDDDDMLGHHKPIGHIDIVRQRPLSPRQQQRQQPEAVAAAAAAAAAAADQHPDEKDPDADFLGGNRGFQADEIKGGPAAAAAAGHAILGLQEDANLNAGYTDLNYDIDEQLFESKIVEIKKGLHTFQREQEEERMNETMGAPFQMMQITDLAARLCDDDPSIMVSILGQMESQYYSGIQYHVIESIKNFPNWEYDYEEPQSAVTNDHLSSIKDDALRERIIAEVNESLNGQKTARNTHIASVSVQNTAESVPSTTRSSKGSVESKTAKARPMEFGDDENDNEDHDINDDDDDDDTDSDQSDIESEVEQVKLQPVSAKDKVNRIYQIRITLKSKKDERKEAQARTEKQRRHRQERYLGDPDEPEAYYELKDFFTKEVEEDNYRVHRLAHTVIRNMTDRIVFRHAEIVECIKMLMDTSIRYTQSDGSGMSHTIKALEFAGKNLRIAVSVVERNSVHKLRDVTKKVLQHKYTQRATLLYGQKSDDQPYMCAHFKVDKDPDVQFTTTSMNSYTKSMINTLQNSFGGRNGTAGNFSELNSSDNCLKEPFEFRVWKEHVLGCGLTHETLERLGIYPEVKTHKLLVANQIKAVADWDRHFEHRLQHRIPGQENYTKDQVRLSMPVVRPEMPAHYPSFLEAKMSEPTIDISVSSDGKDLVPDEAKTVDGTAVTPSPVEDKIDSHLLYTRATSAYPMPPEFDMTPGKRSKKQLRQEKLDAKRKKNTQQPQQQPQQPVAQSQSQGQPQTQEQARSQLSADELLKAEVRKQMELKKQAQRQKTHHDKQAQEREARLQIIRSEKEKFLRDHPELEHNAFDNVNFDENGDPSEGQHAVRFAQIVANQLIATVQAANKNKDAFVSGEGPVSSIQRQLERRKSRSRSVEKKAEQKSAVAAPAAPAADSEQPVLRPPMEPLRAKQAIVMARNYEKLQQEKRKKQQIEERQQQRSWSRSPDRDKENADKELDLDGDVSMGSGVKSPSRRRSRSRSRKHKRKRSGSRSRTRTSGRNDDEVPRRERKRRRRSNSTERNSTLEALDSRTSRLIST